MPLINNNLHLLQTMPLFKRLKHDDIDLLYKNVTERSYEKGQVVCRKDNPACNIFLIKSGTVSELVIDKNDFSTIAVFKKRFDYFGELGVLLEECYITTVVVIAAAKILSVPAEIFRKILWDNPSSMKIILGTFKRGLQNSAERYISCTMFNMEGRLAYLLLLIQPSVSEQGSLLITQEKLSLQCGISRQTISSILNKWKKYDLIDIQRGRIAIRDAGKLTDIVINNSKIF